MYVPWLISRRKNFTSYPTVLPPIAAFKARREKGGMEGGRFRVQWTTHVTFVCLCFTWGWIHGYRVLHLSSEVWMETLALSTLEQHIKREPNPSSCFKHRRHTELQIPERVYKTGFGTSSKPQDCLFLLSKRLHLSLFNHLLLHS